MPRVVDFRISNMPALKVNGFMLDSLAPQVRLEYAGFNIISQMDEDIIFNPFANFFHPTQYDPLNKILTQICENKDVFVLNVVSYSGAKSHFLLLPLIDSKQRIAKIAGVWELPKYIGIRPMLKITQAQKIKREFDLRMVVDDEELLEIERLNLEQQKLDDRLAHHRLMALQNHDDEVSEAISLGDQRLVIKVNKADEEPQKEPEIIEEDPLERHRRLANIDFDEADDANDNDQNQAVEDAQNEKPKPLDTVTIRRVNFKKLQGKI